MAHWEAKRSELDKIDRIDRGCGTWTADGGHVQLPLCPRIPRSSDVIQDERYVYGVVFEAWWSVVSIWDRWLSRCTCTTMNLGNVEA